MHGSLLAQQWEPRPARGTYLRPPHLPITAFVGQGRLWPCPLWVITDSFPQVPVACPSTILPRGVGLLRPLPPQAWGCVGTFTSKPGGEFLQTTWGEWMASLHSQRAAVEMLLREPFGRTIHFVDSLNGSPRSLIWRSCVKGLQLWGLLAYPLPSSAGRVCLTLCD